MLTAQWQSVLGLQPCHINDVGLLLDTVELNRCIESTDAEGFLTHEHLLTNLCTCVPRSVNVTVHVF